MDINIYKKKIRGAPIPVVRSLVQNKKKIRNPNWLGGFSSGEGSFIIGIKKSNRFSTGFEVRLVFMLTQHIRDEELIISLIEYFGSGNVNKYREGINFGVTKFLDIENQILPFFVGYASEGGILR